MYIHLDLYYRCVHTYSVQNFKITLKSRTTETTTKTDSYRRSLEIIALGLVPRLGMLDYITQKLATRTLVRLYMLQTKRALVITTFIAVVAVMAGYEEMRVVR